MTKEEFIALYEKCMAGESTAEELRLLESYKDEFELTDHPWTPEMGDRDEVKAEVISQLRAKMQPEATMRRSNFGRWAAVASILLMIGASLWFYQKKQPVTEPTGAVKKQEAILPGGNKAVLTLANGEQVDLDGAGKGLVADQGNAAVTKSADGQLVYKAANGTASMGATYNTIATPRGGQYQLTLADGTQVWLNAASSLKFPTAFNGDERKVELIGEAYFEVAKDKTKPFKVMVKDMNVKVLGTHFNVMAYDDESDIRTTLLEGSVKLKEGSGTETVLFPGQQGILKHGAKAFQVRTVNLSDVVSWKNGVFVFDNENIQTIMRKVARWYNVDVEYSGDLTAQNFGGSVSRFDNINYLLKTLELTGTVHFKIDGRRIIVMP